MSGLPDAKYECEVYGSFLARNPGMKVKTSQPVDMKQIYEHFVEYIKEKLPGNQSLMLCEYSTEATLKSSGLEIISFNHGGLDNIDAFNLEAHVENLQSPQIGFRKKKIIQLLREYGELLSKNKC